MHRPQRIHLYYLLYNCISLSCGNFSHRDALQHFTLGELYPRWTISASSHSPIRRVYADRPTSDIFSPSSSAFHLGSRRQVSLVTAAVTGATIPRRQSTVVGPQRGFAAQERRPCLQHRFGGLVEMRRSFDIRRVQTSVSTARGLLCS